jgi:thiamine-monophosphate kinase
VSEHELIRRIRALLGDAGGAASGVVLGPGDDCAVLAPAPGRELLLTTDAAIEGVHFDLAWMSAEEAGARAMAANLSDIAAMAGRPRWATLALGLPARPASETAEVALAIVRGAAREAAAHGARLVGGNLARSPAGISITIALAGDVEAGRAVHRSGARAGDEILVTGEPGLARGGLLALQRGMASDAAVAPLVARFRAPRPRIDEAIFLREIGARAMIDLSDGLAGDLAHLAAESGLAAEIDRDALPVPPPLAAFAARIGFDARAIVLEGGEDYELLAAAPPGTVAAQAAAFERRFGAPLSRIGRFADGAGIFFAGGSPIAGVGFDHFRP